MVPFIKIPLFESELPLSTVISENLEGIFLTVNATTEVTNLSTLSVLKSVFFIGQIVFFSLFCHKLFLLRKLVKKGKKYSFKNHNRIIIPDSNTAFSFHKTIFIGDKVSESLYQKIIVHELVHVKEKHTLDLLFFETMKVIFWFNPFVYLFQKRISDVHEFISDKKTVNVGETNPYEFLLNQFFQTNNISFVNSFQKQSLIKKRIKMLQRKNSSKKKLFKYALIVPLFGLLMLIYNSCQDGNQIKVEKKYEVESEAVSFSVVEQVPVYPGCENAENFRTCFQEKIINHIKKHFYYPDEAIEKGIQGRVFVRFTVTEEGSIGDIRLRGPDKLLEEATRKIFEKLPNILPGKHEGKNVSVPFSIPVTYSLKESAKK